MTKTSIHICYGKDRLPPTFDDLAVCDKANRHVVVWDRSIEGVDSDTDTIMPELIKLFDDDDARRLQPHEDTTKENVIFVAGQSAVYETDSFTDERPMWFLISRDAEHKMTTPEREALADEQHAIWTSWMDWLFACSTFNDDGTVTIPAAKVVRWLRQMRTPYAELSEKEKDSDREQADRVLKRLRDVEANKTIEQRADEVTAEIIESAMKRFGPLSPDVLKDLFGVKQAYAEVIGTFAFKMPGESTVADETPNRSMNFDPHSALLASDEFRDAVIGITDQHLMGDHR